MYKSNRQRFFIKIAIFLFALISVPAVVGVITWRISENLLRNIEITIKEVGFFGGGDLCPLYLYDVQGNRYGPFIWAHVVDQYIGSAPLYYVKPSTFLPGADDCQYPEKIPPDIAVTGETIFPLQLEVSVDKTIRQGESSKLSVKAAFSDVFSGNPPDNSVTFVARITSTGKLDVNFELRATNFEFDPPNEKPISSTLTLYKPTDYSWIISPKENVLGEQILTISLVDANEGYYLAFADTYLEVTDIGGLDPYLISALSSVGAFLIILFSILKSLPELRALYKKEFGRQVKEKPPMGFKPPKRNS